MKKTLYIIPILIAVIVTIVWSMRLDVRPGGGMISVTLSSKAHAQEVSLTPDQIKDAALDEYTDSELIQLFDDQYVISYPGTKSVIEIGSIDKQVTDFKADLTVKHWDGDVSFSLIAPVTIDSASKLTSAIITDKVVASNGGWIFEYSAVEPTQEFNEYGGIDIVITAKEKPASNKIYFTYDSTTVTPYYQGELTEKEIEEGASRPDHVIGSIAFYANEKANHAIGGVNYRTGKVGHLYAMRSGESWCRWNIEGEFIVLTIPDVVFNGKYPVVISPVGDTFGYTSIGGSSSFFTGNYLRTNYTAVSPSSDGAGNSIHFYCVNIAYIEGVLYDSSGNLITNGIVTNVAGSGTPEWISGNFATSPDLYSATSYYICWRNQDSGDYYYDSISAKYKYTSSPYGTYPNPVSFSELTSSRDFSIYCTYTPSGGDPDISVAPTSYDFGVVADSAEPYTATDYFTITNNSAMQTDQTIAVTGNTWTGGNAFTHSDTATPGADTVGMKANRGGTWGSGDVIVKYTSPNYIYENCPASTGYDFGIKLYMATSASDAVEKTNTVRISAVAD